MPVGGGPPGGDGVTGRLPNRVEQGRSFLQQGLWRDDSAFRPQALRTLLQLALLVGEGIARHQAPLRASALTYFTLLSLVPVFALVSSILTAIGVTENVLAPVFDQIGRVAPEVSARLLEVVQQANMGRLGSLGAASLFLTTLLGLGSIERALNEIWGVTRGRSWARRIPDYLAALVIAPLLIGTAISLATGAKSQWIVQRLLEQPWLGDLFGRGMAWLPAAMLAAAFGFLYGFMPNTRVKPLSALLGGLVAALGVNAGLSYYVGLSIGAARANALYGGFAQLPLFIVWTYVFWWIVLLGAEVAECHQNLARHRRSKQRSASAASPGPQALGLRVAVEIALRFRDGAPAADAEHLASALGVAPDDLAPVLARLQQAGFVAAWRSEDEACGYLLLRPPERIALDELLGALRSEEPAAAASRVESALAELETSAQRALAGRTLAELLDAPPAER